MAYLKITDASGRQWQFNFVAQTACTIGRAPDNAIVLDDPRASRYHAHIKPEDNGSCDGVRTRSLSTAQPSTNIN